VVTAPREALQDDRLRVTAVTGTGRLASGEARVAEPFPSEPPKAGTEPDPAEKARYPYVIFVNDNAPAQQYPAALQVSGASGVVSKVRVTLNGIVHSCLNDLDVLLVAPNGQSLVLMSDVGGCSPPNAAYLTFDDFAPTSLTSGSPPAGSLQGTPVSYRPSNEGSGDAFPAPAPPPSGATALSAFQGIDPNGEWKLYVVDDKPGDTGQIREGWSLDIVTTTQFCNPAPLTIPDSGAASIYPSTITVSGMPPNLVKATVTLNGLNHTFAADLDVLLTAPGSSTPVMLMSDSGGDSDFSSSQVTFDDDAWTASPSPESSIRP
jgi:subtilisin-like proprotein convertase family protein